MKFFNTLLSVTIFLSFQAFTQVINKKVFLPERPTTEKLKEIHKSNVDALGGLIGNKYWLLNSENSQWGKVLRNQQEGFYIEERFNGKDSRTTIKKILLDDGFLLIEMIEQDWSSSAWVNLWKSTYIYDGNNNMIEELWQDWDGSNWVNKSKYTYTYDGSNNKIEQLLQTWDGSNWIDDWKYIYTYDGNNNMIERLLQTRDGSNWVNDWKYTYTYDVNNNMIEALEQDWDGQN